MMRTALFILLVLLCAPLPANAHPHVWVDYDVVVNGNDQGITALHFNWLYDLMFSSMLVFEGHIKGVGALSPMDTEKVKHNDGEDFMRHHAYTELMVDGKPFEVKDVEHFSVTNENDRLTYHFDITLPAAAKKIWFNVGDPTFYVSFAQKEKTPIVIGHKGISCTIGKKGYASPFGIFFTQPVRCEKER